MATGCCKDGKDTLSLIRGQLHSKASTSIGNSSETNFSKSKVITRRPIKWDEIDFPKEWVIEEIVPPKNNINPDIYDIEQTPDGTVRIKFTD
ncbi:hypothetical protein H5410_044826 [Solanum commersonii]|uniref:Uncharacterized protein n=1 Tax=Solanum commersonii TaxID=4109 RepID=A0A9J5XBZ3_SOLCO|nr:hypothetical protein H5410_044826 [Solanum commersonii]